MSRVRTVRLLSLQQQQQQQWHHTSSDSCSWKGQRVTHTYSVSYVCLLRSILLFSLFFFAATTATNVTTRATTNWYLNEGKLIFFSVVCAHVGTGDRVCKHTLAHSLTMRSLVRSSRYDHACLKRTKFRKRVFAAFFPPPFSIHVMRIHSRRRGNQMTRSVYICPATDTFREL